MITYTETFKCLGSSNVLSTSSVGDNCGVGALVRPAAIPNTSVTIPWNA